MQRSELINELAAALAKAQAEMKAAPKSKENPHFKSKYAPLNEVIEVSKVLAKHGLSFVQPARVEADGAVTVETVLLHSSGQWLSESLSLRPQQNTPQGVGSAITYGRRFGLASLVGIAADEDDDGNEASAKAPIKSNGNGSAKSAAKPEPSPEEQEAIKLEEVCLSGFPSLDEKLKWKEMHRGIINSLPKDLKQAVVAAFDKAAVRQ